MGKFQQGEGSLWILCQRQSTGPAIFLRTQTSGAPDDSDGKDVTYVWGKLLDAFKHSVEFLSCKKFDWGIIADKFQCAIKKFKFRIHLGSMVSKRSFTFFPDMSFLGDMLAWMSSFRIWGNPRGFESFQRAIHATQEQHILLETTRYHVFGLCGNPKPRIFS